MKKKSCVVIGIGNPNFKDDAIGLEVIEALRQDEEVLEFVDLESFWNIDLKVIDTMLGYEKAIVVDAMKTGAEPGTIFEFDGKTTWERVYASGTHSMSIFEVIRIGYTIFPEEMPKEVKVIGIEGKEVLALGKGISEEARQAVEKVKDIIKKECVKSESPQS